MSWREYFGLTEVQPGHYRGVKLVYAVIVGAAVMYLYAAVHG